MRPGVLAIALLLVAAMLEPYPTFADPTTDWTAGPNAVGDNTYVGFIDVPAANATVPTGSFTVSGWFFDTTAEGWAGADDVQVFVGPMGSGGRQLAKPNFAQNRPDVAAALGNPSAAASGFTGIVPANSLSAGPQTLVVYAHTPDKGWWFKQVNVNVSASAPAATTPAPGSTSGSALPVVAIERPKDSEIVVTKSDFDASGYALDRAAPSGCGIDRVSLYIGARDEGGKFLGDADLGFSDTTPVGVYGGQFDSCGWRLTFHPTQFHANTYLMYAYAHSAITGKEDSVARYFAIREQAP